ncbi:hypothetical protein [Cellulomonas sp. URHB0016]
MVDRVVALVVSVLCVGGLTACSTPASAPEPVAQTASAAPTPTPTPTPTPATGVVFENIPAMGIDETHVWSALNKFENAYWRTLTSNEPSTEMNFSISTAVDDALAQLATRNAGAGQTVGGALHARIGDIVVGDGTATGTICNDFRETTFATPTGTSTAADVGIGEPILSSFTLTQYSEGVWTVQTVEAAGSC